MKIILATGGTGGHIFPAIALYEELKANDPKCEILFLGGQLASNQFLAQNQYPFVTISSGSWNYRKPLRFVQNLFRNGAGFLKSLLVLKKSAPDLLVGFGSFYSAPALLAAKVLSIPFVLHEANCFPGQVNRLFARYAKMTAIQFPIAARYLRGNVACAKMPVRAKMVRNGVGKSEALDYFSLHAKKKTVLIFGGSQGANAINWAVPKAMQSKKDYLQIIHLTGSKESAAWLQKEYNKYDLEAAVKDFEVNMHLAWQAADLVISRAGASTLAEQLEFEIPAILIPFPYAKDNHQLCNARYMSEEIGGGCTLMEEELSAETISARVDEIFVASESIKKSIQEYKKKNPCSNLSEIITNA